MAGSVVFNLRCELPEVMRSGSYARGATRRKDKEKLTVIAERCRVCIPRSRDLLVV
jgi:hypothetical protein